MENVISVNQHSHRVANKDKSRKIFFNGDIVFQ